jgi:hypothetical protein
MEYFLMLLFLFPGLIILLIWPIYAMLKKSKKVIKEKDPVKPKIRLPIYGAAILLAFVFCLIGTSF